MERHCEITVICVARPYSLTNAERDIDITMLSVCLSVCPSVTLRGKSKFYHRRVVTINSRFFLDVTLTFDLPILEFPPPFTSVSVASLKTIDFLPRSNTD